MSFNKIETYRQVSQEILSVLEVEIHFVTRMATVSCLLHQAFPCFYWTGFYMVDPYTNDQLVVGPYQGTLGCLRIPFGKGVCGAAASKEETQIVGDVNSFPGHISCDGLTKSEIVVPVWDSTNELIAVLDIDSKEPGYFDQTDREALEHILSHVFSEG
ncbi:MAG: GAF domain-containing protein [Sphingomonadales bacterium]